MAIRYEANPPKILLDSNLDDSIGRFVEKIKLISSRCDAIHLTENVLGAERVSPIHVGGIIKKQLPDLPITVSLRVRDKSKDDIINFVQDCIATEFDGILVLMGDPSRTKCDSGLIPSNMVRMLNDMEYGSKIDLYLSVSNTPNFAKLTKKLAARPKGFVTQVIQNIDQVRTISGHLKSFSITPIVLYPSKKNTRSAEFLNIDMGQYKDSFSNFVSEIHDITGDVLITSPNDFDGLIKFLESYYRY